MVVVFRSMPRIAAVLPMLAAGCVFGELDYTGKSCPCPDGWDCVAGQCAAPTASQCAIQPESFRVGWTAPTTILWQWEARGEAESFSAYRLRLGEGTGPEQGDAQVLTAAEQPELGYFVYPNQSDPPPIHMTMTLGLAPETLHWAQLEAIDSTGCVWSSAIVNATTAPDPPPDRRLVVFDETIPASWIVAPSGLLHQDAMRADSGGFYLEWTAPDSINETNIQLYELGIPLTPVVSFQSAFIEYRVALSDHVYWSRVVLEATPAGDSTPDGSRLEGFALRGDDTYRTVQVPLRVLEPDMPGQPDYAAEHVFYRFLTGASPFLQLTTMRLDNIVIRW
jgi:hypothetical protein